jgi:hypothetical protein
MRSIYLTVGFLLCLPALVYAGFKQQFPSEPDIVYVKAPGLFAGKWDKVGSSDDFTEYLNKPSLTVNEDMTISAISMRHYALVQADALDEVQITYKSKVLYQTINCFHQTITTTKVYLITGPYANGPIASDPVELYETPKAVRPGSIAQSKVDAICSIENKPKEAASTKAVYMQNI